MDDRTVRLKCLEIAMQTVKDTPGIAVSADNVIKQAQVYRDYVFGVKPS